MESRTAKDVLALSCLLIQLRVPCFPDSKLRRELEQTVSRGECLKRQVKRLGCWMMLGCCFMNDFTSTSMFITDVCKVEDPKSKALISRPGFGLSGRREARRVYLNMAFPSASAQGLQSSLECGPLKRSGMQLRASWTMSGAICSQGAKRTWTYERKKAKITAPLGSIDQSKVFQEDRCCIYCSSFGP